jgi:hypothetical protein
MQYSLEWKKMDITEKMEGCDALEQLILVQLFKANLTKPQKSTLNYGHTHEFSE